MSGFLPIAMKSASTSNLLFSFVNSDDEKFLVYTDGKKDEDGMVYAYIGKKNGNNLLNDVEDKDIEIALELLEKIEKDD